MAAICECERVASRVTAWHLSLVPGLLQITDYARSVSSAKAEIGSIDPSEVEPRLAAKDFRRQALVGSDPLPYRALIAESVLRNPVAAPEVMVDQLGHILRMRERENLSVSVVPQSSGWHPGLLGPFVLYEFLDSDPVVYLEHYSSSAFNQDGDDVDAYRRAIAGLAQIALSEPDSCELISCVKNEWTKQCS